MAACLSHFVRLNRSSEYFGSSIHRHQSPLVTRNTCELAARLPRRPQPTTITPNTCSGAIRGGGHLARQVSAESARQFARHPLGGVVRFAIMVLKTLVRAPSKLQDRVSATEP